jgi:hypothetical protein
MFSLAIRARFGGSSVRTFLVQGDNVKYSSKIQWSGMELFCFPRRQVLNLTLETHCSGCAVIYEASFRSGRSRD